MKCPRCSVIVGQRAPSCHGCGFSLPELSALYGNQTVIMDRLHDDAHCLLKRERDQITETMDAFESRFPQLFFCAYLSNLPEGTRLSELGFWLLNYAAVSSVDIDRPNENAIVLMVDMHAGSVGLSMGYYAEALFDEESTEKALLASRPWLLNAEYGNAVVTVIKQLAKSLSYRSRMLRRRPPEACESLLNPFGRPELPALRPSRSPAAKTKISV